MRSGDAVRHGPAPVLPPHISAALVSHLAGLPAVLTPGMAEPVASSSQFANSSALAA